MIISLLLELNNQFSINEIISTIIVYGVLFFAIRKYFPQYLKYVFYIWIIDLFIGYNIYRTNKIHNNYKKEFISFNKEVLDKIDEKVIIYNSNEFESKQTEIPQENPQTSNIKMIVKKEFPSRENTKDKDPLEFVSQEENKIIEN
jgi:hypothetical protein